MATRNESDNTRGRANALRLAISGQLGPNGLTDPELYPVMDLCLECKACKSECPTGVDMARLKSEFLHQYYREHGTPFRSRVLASAERAAVVGSRYPHLSNWIANNPLTRWLNEKLLRIDRRRTLPTYAERTFVDWWVEHSTGGRSGESDSSIAVFADTFTNFYEPQHGIATVRLAERLGLDVVVPPRVCCGRPLISKGFLDRAIVQVEATANALFPLAQQGVSIVFCEPGCYSAVRDDHPLLLRGELREKAEQVASACVTFEEWAESVLDSANSGVDINDGPSKILLHGHCHQKALVGISPAMKLLSRIPNCEVIDPDTGCCGMAGSFGYEREHYAVSQAVGEHKLFPTIREQEPGAVVVAPGFSCRHQIKHFTGVAAVSAMELLDSLMRD